MRDGLEDEPGDQREDRVGDEVDQQVVALVALARPAGEDREHADQDRRGDAGEDRGEDDREEARGDEDPVGAHLDPQQVAGDAEHEQGPEQGQVPIARRRARSTATTATTARAINWIAIARRVGRSVISSAAGGAVVRVWLSLLIESGLRP